MDENYTVGFGLCIILILTLLYEPTSNAPTSNAPPIREGLDIGKEMRKSFEKPIKDVKKATQKEFNKAKKATTKEFDKAKKETTKGLNVVKKGTEKVANAAKKGFDDIFSEITKIVNYIVCGVNKIKTLPDCFFWYFLDIIYGIFYLFYSMLAMAIPPLKDMGKMVISGVKMADEAVYDIMGFHFMGYPKSVMDKCYLCKGAPKAKRPKKSKCSE